MTSSQDSAAVIQAPPALKAYASRLLIDHVRTATAAGAAIEGAILYLDIVGSTGLAHRYAAAGPDGAERLGDVLSRYFRAVFTLIADRQGDVVAMEGDSVMALWRDEPGSPPAAALAAEAALALHARLAGDGISQRIMVTAGRLTVVTLELSGDRRILLLSGPPIRALNSAAANCPPGGVALPPGVEPLAAKGESSPSQNCSDSELAPFLPRPIVDRIVAGHGSWLAEFRDLTAIMLRLDGMEAETEGGAPLAAAVRAVDAAFHGVGLGVAEVAEGDKGTLLRVAVGIPPYVLDNNALGAVEGARRALEALDRLGVVAGAGVATGRAFAMEVGHENRRVPTILGPVMNRAARLMEMAKGEALVCEATAAAASGRFDFAEPTAFLLKGDRAPTLVRRLHGRRAPRPAVSSGVGLFGRDAEAARLADFLDRPSLGQGALAVIEGEPGAGKSHLLAHAEGMARQRGGAVFFAAAQSIEQETSYFVFRQVLAQLAGGEPGQEEASPDSEGRLRSLLDGDPLLQRVEALTDLLPLDPAILGGSERLTGASRRGAVADLLTRLMRVAGPRIVLLLDDAHWLDRSSAWLLATLLPRLPGLLVVAASRPLEPGVAPELEALLRDSALRASLARLDREAIGELIRANLGGAIAPPRLIAHVHARSEGLPLHAEQLVLAMRDRGLVIRSADGRHIDLDVDVDSHVDVDTLRDVILRRFDLLPPRRQMLLKVASVLGRNFDLALLAPIHPDPPGDPQLQADLAALTEVGLLERGPRGFAFRHIRIQEAICDLLPFAQRRALHRAAAMAIEGAQGGERAANYAQLATHWELAAEPAKGAAYRLRAADRALGIYAHHEALAQLRAIERAGGHEDLLPAKADQAEFAQIWGRAAQELTDFELARPWLLRCAALRGVRVRQDRPALIGGVAREVLTQILLRARFLRPRPPGEAAERDALAAVLHNRFAEHAYFDGDSLRLLHDTLVALNCAELGDNLRDLIIATGAVSIGLGAAGMLPLARYYQRRAVAIAETREPWDLAIAKMQSAVVATDLGEWPLMQAMGSEGAALFAEIGEQDRFATCRTLLAYALIAMGNVTDAECGLTEFGEFAEKIDKPRVAGWVVTARALIDLMTGKPPRCALERLAAVREDHLAPGEKTLVCGLKAGAALAAGDRAEATALVEECLGYMRLTRSIGLAYHGAAAATAACVALAEAAPADAVAQRRAKEAARLMRRVAKRAVVWQGFAFWLLGREAALGGRTATAKSLYRRGLAVAERLGTPYEAALCRRGLGDTKSASATLERMGCVPWLEFSGERKT